MSEKQMWTAVDGARVLVVAIRGMGISVIEAMHEVEKFRQHVEKTDTAPTVKKLTESFR